MKKIFIILLLSFYSLVSFALHTKGGWVSYQYLGPGSSAMIARYKIVVYIYMIPNPGLGQKDAQINLTIFAGASNIIYQNSTPAPLVSEPNVQNCKFCNPCIVNAPDIQYKYAIYETTVDLPISTEGYTIAYQRCCRIGGINNIINSSAVGDTWAIHIPGTNNGATAPINSSPQFIANDTAIICANNFFRFDFTATDADGDSLVYEFAPALVGASGGTPSPVIADGNFVSVPYNPPFTALEPLGSNVTINPKTGVVSGIAPPGTGDYVITAVAKEYRNGVYISESRKSLHIQVASCNLVSAALSDDNSCDGFTKIFRNNVSDPPGAAYSWDFGVTGITTDVSNLPNPTFTYPDTGTYKVTLAISLNGLCTDTATALIKVYPRLNPDFSPTGQCKNTPILFTDNTQTTYGVVNSWQWTFGEQGSSNTSVSKNPSHTYNAAGSYSVTLNVTNNKGCESTITKTITIKDQPDLSVTNDTLICSTDTLQLNAIGSGTFSWSPNYNINNQNRAAPLVSPDVPTKYYVTLTDPFGCTARDSVFVDVKQFVTIDAGKDTGLCAGDPLQLSVISDALHYSWSPTASLNDPLIKNPIATPAVTTKFYVIGNIGKCQSLDSVTIRVAPYPGTAGIPDTLLCLGSSIQLHASGGSLYSWSPSFYLSNSNIPDPVVVNPDRTIRYIVTIQDTLGCPKASYDTVLVQVYKPFADAGPRDTSIVINQPLQLNATGGQIYLWTPSTGLSDPFIANPVATISDDIDYILTTSTSSGCFAMDTISIKVFKISPGIYVPSAFTPNGDGKNDLFRPIAIGIKQITYFKVFNRWGVLVYSSGRGTYEQALGWDGNYKGRPQDTDVFVWVAEGIDYLDKKITQKGTVTLIR